MRPSEVSSEAGGGCTPHRDRPVNQARLSQAERRPAPDILVDYIDETSPTTSAGMVVKLRQLAVNMPARMIGLYSHPWAKSSNSSSGRLSPKTTAAPSPRLIPTRCSQRKENVVSDPDSAAKTIS